jgi:hypothetical protein
MPGPKPVMTLVGAFTPVLAVGAADAASDCIAPPVGNATADIRVLSAAR